MQNFTIKELTKKRKILQNYTHHFEEIDSTNEWLAQKKEFPQGSIVSCDFQKKGKGRWGKNWLAKKKTSTMFSVLYIPSLSIPIHSISLCVGVALFEALEKYNIDGLALKWPNDLLVGKKKIAGILCENLQGKIIIGVGINTNQLKKDFPLELQNKATSLLLASEKNYYPFSILELVTYHLDKILVELESGKQKNIFGRWEKYSTPYKTIDYCLQGQKYRGKIQKLDSIGNLLVMNESGELQSLNSGEITLTHFYG